MSIHVLLFETGQVRQGHTVLTGEKSAFIRPSLNAKTVQSNALSGTWLYCFCRLKIDMIELF